MAYSDQVQQRRRQIEGLALDFDPAWSSCIEGEGEQSPARIFPQEVGGGRAVHGEVVGNDKEHRILPGRVALELLDEFPKRLIGAVNGGEQLGGGFAGTGVDRSFRCHESIRMMGVDGQQCQQERAVLFAQNTEFFRSDAEEYRIATAPPFAFEAEAFPDLRWQCFCSPKVIITEFGEHDTGPGEM
ncbi:MAG: hypothetical protein L6W00_21905 [Lentisphaeria bacterium]|nr:MAG: hypothetical protein L6W00_21905 [Lentisphaeria bacterium]